MAKKENFPEGTAVITEREIRKIKNPEKYISLPKQKPYKTVFERQPRTFKPRNIGFLQRLNPAPALSREQEMFQEVFSGEGAIMSGDGSCLPSTNNGNLGTQKFGGDGETGQMFGFRKYPGGY
jgi:hypothetical protein